MNSLPSALGASLLILARNAIARELEAPVQPEADLPALQTPGASFVTLTRNGQLRGCMGSLHATRALALDVQENAHTAAFGDPRFAPLSAEEWPAIRIEISVLGPSTFNPCPTEEDALRRMTPFLDGVILRSGSRQASFLPQVWEQLPEAQTFLAHLLQKAGLPVALWPSDMQLGVYRVEKFMDSA